MDRVIDQIHTELINNQNHARATTSQGYFKLEPDVKDTFLGVSVPTQRKIAH